MAAASETLLVRRLHPGDADVAASLARRFLGEEVAPDRLRRLLDDDRNLVLAATRGAEHVGYLVAHEFPSLPGETLVYLYDIEVAETERRQGIGRRLVSLLLEICRARGVDQIWVGSSLTNDAAIALWKATGATRVSDQYVEFTYTLRP